VVLEWQENPQKSVFFLNGRKKRENRPFFSFPEPRKIGHLKKKSAGKIMILNFSEKM